MRAPLVWQPYPCDDARADAVAQELGVSPVLARLLAIRGLTDVEAASRFMKPSLDHLLDPMGLTDMDRAVDRLTQAIARGERIAVHGDYDVDGITSTVILRRALAEVSAMDVPTRLEARYQKFRKMGSVGIIES